MLVRISLFFPVVPGDQTWLRFLHLFFIVVCFRLLTQLSFCCVGSVSPVSCSKQIRFVSCGT